MAEQDRSSVTQLLRNWQAGDAGALEALIPEVYGELHRIAHRYLRGERADHTLQSTALVNEAYLRLVDQRIGTITDRAHFIGVAAHLMRQVLVDSARVRRAAKRDYGVRVELEEALGVAHSTDIDVIALDDALSSLEQMDAGLARLVEMRYFGGLSIEDTALATGVSAATVKREWASARAWLVREMGADTPNGGGASKPGV